MSFDQRFHRPANAFQRVLDRVKDDRRPAMQIAVVPGDDKLQPPWIDSPRGPLSGAAAVSALYAENQPWRDPEPAPPQRQEFDLAAHAAQIRRELGQNLSQNLSIDDLRRLRRRCAFVAHPDRAPGLDRAQAEQFMADINAAIDKAIQSRAGPQPKD